MMEMDQSDMKSVPQVITELYKERYQKKPDFLVRAPGRVNLIGEHTDYNDGFVLPMAIDRAIWIALAPTIGHEVRIFSVDFDEEAAFSLDEFQNLGTGWVEYVKGVAWAIQSSGIPINGWVGVMGGDVPRGAGLSSSAALELAVARAFQSVSDFPWVAGNMALLAQKAENQWVGVNCGIMDQMISAAGVAGHALLIDCRSLETHPAPLPESTVIVVMDTGTRRGLVDSAYNERRRQCEIAASFFGLPALRDVKIEQFEKHASELDILIRRRARHVISENQRTLLAVAAMEHSDATELGKLMIASHMSLRDDFEVSRLELDIIVNLAVNHSGCYGARMTGAGFGGCAVALVQADLVDDFVSSVTQEYQVSTGIKPNLYICKATNGAEFINLTFQS